MLDFPGLSFVDFNIVVAPGARAPISKVFVSAADHRGLSYL